MTKYSKKIIPFEKIDIDKELERRKNHSI